VLDFDEVLARGASKPSSDQDEEGDPDRPIFSLLTGKYRHAKRYGGGELLRHLFIRSSLFIGRNTTTENHPVPAPPPSSSALVLRDQDSTIATLKDTAAGVLFSLCATYQTTESSSRKGEFLQSRTFRGLETRTGLDPPSVLQQGRSGIARGYDDDHRA
jgi:diphthamide biosynthesis protein 2